QQYTYNLPLHDGLPILAGKTGTTETNFDASKVNDQWIVGYTPDVVISTWLGYEKTTTQHYLTSTSGQGLGQVFKAQAQGILPYRSEEHTSELQSRFDLV